MSAEAEARALYDRFSSALSKGKDNEELAKDFIAKGVRVPNDLVLASLGNRGLGVPSCPKALRVLLEGRGDPNCIDPHTTAPAIHAACWHGSVDVLKVLLDCRANIEQLEDRMRTPPLNTALAAGNAKVALELLNRRANVQWTHEDGASALHVAMAWIASSHNANLRLPPLGEEPVAVVTMMLHNGVDPLQTEGKSRSSTRGSGMTPLESFRREVAQSPWRTDPQIGQRFDKTAAAINDLLQQAEKAMRLKLAGNKAFSEEKFDEALSKYAEARTIWKELNIRGHHTAVLWSNTATAYKKMGDAAQCRSACEEGITHYCTDSIQNKLNNMLEECNNGQITAPAPAPKVRASKLEEKFLERAPEKGGLYPETGSVQGKVENPGPFICNFEEAKEAGFVDGVPGWKERAEMDLQKTDEELVRTGFMSPDLLDENLKAASVR